MKAASLSARLDRMPMVKAVAPFAAGILAADCFTLPLWFLAGAFLLSGTLALLLHSQSGALVMLLTAGFAASQLRDTAHTLPRGIYTTYELTVEGIPAERGRYTSAEATAVAWRDPSDGTWHASGDRIMLYADSLTALYPGERIRCRGSVRPFRGGAESYRRLMARRGFAGTLWLSERTLIERLPGRSSALHLHAVERMQRIGMRDDAGAVCRAMVTGDRTHLSKELRTAYRGAGLSHVLVVSGMHVSILCGDVLGRLLPRRKKRLRGYTGRRVRALFSAVLALLLVGVTGFTPSVLRAAGAVWLSALGVWVYGPPDALTSLGVAGVLMTAGNSYAVCDVGFQLSFAAVVGTLAGGAVVRRSQEAWEKQRAKKKHPRLRFWKRKALGLAGSLWETVCISACASMATFPVLVLRGMSTSLYALVSGTAVLWLVEPILLTGLGAALLGLAPALAPAQRVCSCCAELLAEVLDRWALWVSGWPGAQIWFDTAYAAVVCLLLAGLCWLAFHNRVRLRVALPALLLTAGLAVFTGNALSRDVVRVELVGSRNAPAVVISRNESAVILFRGGDVTRCAVETTLERRNIRTVECLIDLRLRPRSAQRMGAEQRIAVDRMALYATRRVRCGPAEVEVLRTRNGCVARIQAAGQTFVTLSGSAALAAPVQADTLLASPARPDCVKYEAILSLSSDYRWMPEALSSGQLCHSFSRAE